MKKEFEKLKLYKTKDHYCFKKTIWMDNLYVYKKYEVNNSYQLEKFKESFKIYKHLYNDFSF